MSSTTILIFLALGALGSTIYLVLMPWLNKRAAAKRRSEAAKVAAQKRTRTRKEKALKPFTQDPVPEVSASTPAAWPFPTQRKGEGKTATNGTGRHLND